MNKILVDRVLLERVLETLEGTTDFVRDDCKHVWAAVTELRAALEQPQVEQAPLAYYVMNGVARYQLFVSKAAATLRAKEEQKRHDLSGSLAAFHVVPLYASPQPKRQPLTDDQIDAMFANAEIGDVLAERVRKRNQEIYWFGVRDAEAAHGIGA